MKLSGSIFFFFFCLFTFAWMMPRETVANEFAKFLDEYVRNPVRRYQPDDPWTRSRFFRIQTGYAGLFRDCDDEEQKRLSPYICWKCSPCPTVKERFVDFISCDLDQVKQRIRDGAGACCTTGKRRADCRCPSCARGEAVDDRRRVQQGVTPERFGDEDCTCPICQENRRHRSQLEQQATKQSQKRPQQQAKQQDQQRVKSPTDRPFTNQFVADHSYAVDPEAVVPNHTATERQSVASDPDSNGRWPNRNSIQDLLPKKLPKLPVKVAEQSNDLDPPWRTNRGSRR